MSDDQPRTDPTRTVLLVMDYQVDLVESLDDGEALLERAAHAIATVRGSGARVGHVRVAFEDADLQSVPATSGMAAAIAARGRALHVDAPGSAIHPRVAPELGDLYVRKTRVGAFSTTDLADQLQVHGIDTLVLAGISTSGVVLSTVRDAYDRDYRLVVLADACADRDADVHRVLLERVFPRQATVMTVAELSGWLAGG